MISVRLLKPGEAPCSVELAPAGPGAGPFLVPAWYQALREGLRGFEPGVAAISGGDSDPEGSMRAVLPFFLNRRFGWWRLFSFPFGSYGGLLQADGAETPDPADVAGLMEALVRFPPRPVGLLQIVDYPGRLVDLVPPPIKTIPVSNHLLDLSGGFDEVWRKRFDRRVRKFVRQSRRKGVRIVRIDDQAGLDSYVAVARATSLRHGNRPYPDAFFRSLSLGPGKDHCAVHLAVKEERVLAGSLHLYGGDSLFNWLTASHPEAWSDRPVQALISHVIEEAAREGYRWYNLGASPPGAAGLIEFKTGFGAFRHEYFIHQYISPFYRSMQAAGRLIRRF